MDLLDLYNQKYPEIGSAALIVQTPNEICMYFRWKWKNKNQKKNDTKRIGLIKHKEALLSVLINIHKHTQYTRELGKKGTKKSDIGIPQRDLSDMCPQSKKCSNSIIAIAIVVGSNKQLKNTHKKLSQSINLF